MGFWCKAAEGYWGFFLRVNGTSSLPAFDRRVPLRFARGSGIPWSGIISDSTRWKIPGGSLRADLRPFPPRGCLPFCAADVVRASAGDAGGFLRHSRGASGGCSSPAVLGGGGLWTEGTLFSMEPRDRGRRRSYRWSCCPEPGSESRRSLGQRLGGDILLVP